MAAQRFSSIALMGNTREARVLEALRILATHLVRVGCRVRVSRSVRARAWPARVRRVADAQLGVRADLVIAVGGDGSMLYAARQIAGRAVPLLGINRGRLGFLADVGPEQMLARVDEVLAGRYVSETRMLLDCAVVRDGRELARARALNDVVVKRHATGRMVEYQTFIDGTYVNTHLGDGFIIATPTGSTAYALSCGGPIVAPGLEALLLTPICPHTLSDRPLVVPGHCVAEVRLRAAEADRADVTCDGETLGRLGPGWTVRVSAARERIELVHPLGYDYYDILRSKLLWGRDTRERGEPVPASPKAPPIPRRR
jgi:NAD+ kinase